MTTQKAMATQSRTQIFRTLAQIKSSQPVTPRLQRITLTGEGLTPLCKGQRLPGDAIKLYLPAVGQPGFMPEFRVLPSAEHEFAIRPYTIRRFDPEALELDIDVVLHGDSPGSVWARSVQAGDEVGFVGPRHDFLAPEDTEQYILLGDETALPAICAIAESLPETVKAEIFIEVEGAADELAISSKADLNLRWLHRGDMHPAQSELLITALREVTGSQDNILDKVFVWAAGETSIIRDLRRYLRKECGLAKENLHVAGYWRAGLNSAEFDQQTVKEYQSARAAGKKINNHHDLDQLDD